MRSLFTWLIMIIVCCLFSGCTIHFKGENIELDADRQRVYKFDGITWSKTKPISRRGPVELYSIDSVGLSVHKFK